MTECIIQEQCLNPWLTFDAPDCIRRKSCDEPLLQPFFDQPTPQKAEVQAADPYPVPVPSTTVHAHGQGEVSAQEQTEFEYAVAPWSAAQVSPPPSLRHMAPVSIRAFPEHVDVGLREEIPPVDIFSVLILVVMIALVCWIILNAVFGKTA